MCTNFLGDLMKKSYLYAATSILLWSTTAAISKLLLNKMDSFQVLMYSSLFAFLTLLIILIATKKIKLIINYRLSDYLKTLLIGLPGTFFYYVFYYLGTERMEASQAFIVNYLWPIMSVVFAVIILHEPMTTRKGLAIAISFLGILTVTGKEILNFNKETLLGAALCALGAVAYGLYTALNKKWQYDDLLTVMISSLASFVVTLIINLFGGEIVIPNALETLGFIWNGSFIIGIATVTWGLATRAGNTAKVSNLAYLTPFLSLIFTYFILDEQIKPLSIIGLLIIILGIFIQLKDKKN